MEIPEISNLAKGKTVVITGGTRGIGCALVEAFIPHNEVFYCGSSKESVLVSMEGFTKKFPQRKGHFHGFPCQVQSAAEVQIFAKGVLDKSGGVDVLINNAGITRDGLLLRMKPEAWDKVIEVNLKGAFLITQAFLKELMKSRNGSIINISSIVGIQGNAGQANYAASKAGLIGFGQSLAKELAPRNVRVNAIAPGFIETDMTGNIFKTEVEKSAFLGKIPLGRLGTTQDISNLALFLVSDFAKYITGQVFTVDGGLAL